MWAVYPIWKVYIGGTCEKSPLHICGHTWNVESQKCAHASQKNHSQLLKFYVIIVYELCKLCITCIIFTNQKFWTAQNPIHVKTRWPSVHGRKILKLPMRYLSVSHICVKLASCSNLAQDNWEGNISLKYCTINLIWKNSIAFNLQILNINLNKS